MTAKSNTDDEETTMTAVPRCGDVQKNLKTLPDIACILRGMTAEIGAEEFVLCLAGRREAASPLIRVMDSAYPGISPSANRLVAHLPGWLLVKASASLIPLWWKGCDASAVVGLEAAPWAERVELASVVPGVILPLCTERGQKGLLLFSGGAISVDPDRLTAIQARCFGLFAVAVDVWPLRNRAGPPISKRELECLKLTANGHTSEEIGRLLGLSVHTTNQYLTSTTQKLNAVNRVHAVAKAIREGLIN